MNCGEFYTYVIGYNIRGTVKMKRKCTNSAPCLKCLSALTSERDEALKEVERLKDELEDAKGVANTGWEQKRLAEEEIKLLKEIIEDSEDNEIKALLMKERNKVRAETFREAAKQGFISKYASRHFIELADRAERGENV